MSSWRQTEKKWVSKCVSMEHISRMLLYRLSTYIVCDTLFCLSPLGKYDMEKHQQQKIQTDEVNVIFEKVCWKDASGKGGKGEHDDSNTAYFLEGLVKEVMLKWVKHNPILQRRLV